MSDFVAVWDIVVVAGLALFGSFVCSLFEAILYSVTPSKLDVFLQRGVFGVKRLVKLREHIDEPIAAILTINTITHTVGSAVTGAMVGDRFGNHGVGLFAAIFTLAILVLTEIIPKSIGVRYANTLAPLIAWPVQVMIWMVWPVVKVSGQLTRLLKSRHDITDAPTEEEIMLMSRRAALSGQLRPQELRWVENALRLDSVKAGDLMTPRTVVYRLPADMPLTMVKERSKHWNHSRLPLTEDRNPDQIVGMVYRREVFDHLVQGQKTKTLRDLSHPIDFVPETLPAHTLLDKFIKEKKHMVAVIDEYGGFEGVVTLEDVLECLLGSEIVDETDVYVDMQELARRRAAQRHRLLAANYESEFLTVSASTENPESDPDHDEDQADENRNIPYLSSETQREAATTTNANPNADANPESATDSHPDRADAATREFPIPAANNTSAFSDSVNN